MGPLTAPVHDTRAAVSGRPTYESAHLAFLELDSVRSMFAEAMPLLSGSIRANSGKQLEESASKLREAIRGSYPDAYSTARKLQAVLELRLGEPLTEDEVTYLTLHVARMVDEDRL